ncbi:hypothetical protein JCM1840_000946 [Sporobolomyces johnsonii]
MSASDSPLLTLSRCTAAVGLGLASGLMLSLPLWTMPTIFSVSTLAPRDRLHIWSKIFDRGFTTAKAIFPAAGLLFALSAWATKAPVPYLPSSWIGRNRKARSHSLHPLRIEGLTQANIGTSQVILALCSVLTFSIGPYTALTLGPINRKLKQAELDILADPPHGNGAVETDYLIQDWIKYHTLRCALPATAFLLAIAELAFA